MQQLIKGVRLIAGNDYKDGRGRLTAFEYPGGIPFVVRRAFTLRDCPGEEARAEHSNSSDQLVIILAGSLTIDLDNGEEKSVVSLRDGNQALLIRAGVWLRMRDFAQGTIVLVLSPTSYSKNRQFPTPQPDLMSVT
jgi:hypothetical protein